MQSVPWEPLPSDARRKALRSDKAAILCCAARCSSSSGPLNRSLARPTDPVWHSSMCRRTRSSVMGVYLKGRASVGHRRCRVGHVKTDHWGFPFLSFFFLLSGLVGSSEQLANPLPGPCLMADAAPYQSAAKWSCLEDGTGMTSIIISYSQAAGAYKFLQNYLGKTIARYSFNLPSPFSFYSGSSTSPINK